MFNDNLRSHLDNFKSSHSCIDYLSTLGFHVPFDGALIVTPRQIRPDDHDPSFCVHHSFCYDFGTRTSYDIFALDMLFHHRDFLSSVEALTGLRFTQSHSAIATNWAEERQKLADDVKKWHECLLTNPVIHRIAQDRDEGALDYLLDRKITLDFIKKEQIGFNPETKRIIFPYRRNGQIVYIVGRDFSGRCELPKDDPRRHDTPKYQKLKITDALDHCPWGLHTLHPKKSSRHTPSDDFYETPYADDLKDDTLIICEGMVDVAVFAQNGWQCLSPIGGTFRNAIIPEILDIARLFKRVFICFDNDGKGSEFQRNWARRLFEAQIPFVCGHTAEQGTPKFDVADYYRAACNNYKTSGHRDEQEAGAYALQELVRRAVPGISEISRSLYSLQKVAEFLERSARYATRYDLLALKHELKRRTRTYTDPSGNTHEVPLFSKEDLNFMFQGAFMPPPEQDTADEVCAHHTLTYSIDDAFYEFNGNHWEKKHEQFVRRYVYSLLGKKASDGRVGKVIKTLKTRIADDRAFDTEHVFTFTNGVLLLDEDDEAGNKGRLVRPSPEYRATIHVGYRYIAGARSREWEQFIDEVCCGDAALVRELQKACGSILMSDNSLHKMYYLIGDGRNGKSTLLTVLRSVFGEGNGSSVRPDRMGEEFAPMAMKGKLYNFCFEGGRYLKGSEETLKSIVAGDPIMAAHKGVDAVEFVPRAKLFIAANNMFNARDLSEGFIQRFVFFPFNNVFEHGDPELAKKLCSNLAGIFNWCLAGYRLLMKEGFIECPAQKRTRTRFVEHIEPLRVFLRETFTGNFNQRPLGDMVTYSEYPSLKQLYSCYKNWSLDAGYTYTNRGIFTERLRFLAPRLERADGLEALSVQEIEGQECLIIPEMDETIYHAEQAGALNTAHAVVASRRMIEKFNQTLNAAVEAQEEAAKTTEVINTRDDVPECFIVQTAQKEEVQDKEAAADERPRPQPGNGEQGTVAVRDSQLGLGLETGKPPVKGNVRELPAYGSEEWLRSWQS
ncbi:MAG: toprim domain-containing protein [Synergistaceae bacterium]|nr:toprim domain-containing protein [Synergistaceae bacterium]